MSADNYISLEYSLIHPSLQNFHLNMNQSSALFALIFSEAPRSVDKSISLEYSVIHSRLQKFGLSMNKSSALFYNMVI